MWSLTHGTDALQPSSRTGKESPFAWPCPSVALALGLSICPLLVLGPARSAASVGPVRSRPALPSRLRGPVRPKTVQCASMDGPPLHTLSSQVRASPAAPPPPVPRTTRSLVDSGLGDEGGGAAFSGSRRVPFTPGRSDFKKQRVSLNLDLLTSLVPSSPSSSKPLEPPPPSSKPLEPPPPSSSSSSSKPPEQPLQHPRSFQTQQDFPLPYALRSSQTPEWEVAPARVGCPGRKVYARGSKRDVRAFESSEASIKGAIKVYEKDKFAASSKSTRSSHLKWWSVRCKVRRWAPYPLTVPKLQYAAALLKNAHYRSAGQYLSAFKRQHIKSGHQWDDALHLEFRDALRSCSRGLGPSKQSGYFDVDALFTWGQTTTRDRSWPRVKGGPCLPREATEVACHWALREIEISSARVGAVSFQRGEGCGIASFNLPVSKSDVHALGKVRTHGCACPAACPVLALRKLFDFAVGLRDPVGLREPVGLCAPAVGGPCPSGASPSVSKSVALKPLCPTPAGGFPTKEGMVAVFQRFGSELGVTKQADYGAHAQGCRSSPPGKGRAGGLEDPDLLPMGQRRGPEVYSGRPTGAQPQVG